MRTIWSAVKWIWTGAVLAVAAIFMVGLGVPAFSVDLWLKRRAKR